jgi:RecA-family ATPase
MEKFNREEELLKFADEYLMPTSEDKEENLLTHLMKWNDFFELNIKAEYLLEGLIPKGGITLLFSRGGLGKTSLMLQVSRAIAEGISFGELQTIKTPVYYIDFENPLIFLKERIEKIGRSENLYVWHISNNPMPPRLDSKEWELYRKLPPGLLVFDTLRAGHLLDENNSRDMALIVSRLKELREKGFTIVLLHHTPKGNDAIYKGSTAILDLADHVLGLEALNDTEDDTEFDPTKTYRLATHKKTRYEPHKIYLVFNRDIKGFEFSKDPDIEKMEDILGILRDSKESTKQKDLIEKIKNEYDFSTGEIRRLLRKGTGTYWEVTRGDKNAMLYSVFQNSSYIDQKTEKQKISIQENPKNTLQGNTTETLAHSEFSSFFNGFQKTEKQDNDDEDQEHWEFG